MKIFFYSKLALTNIKKNGKIYFPYLLTSTFTVMMFYLIHSLSVNQGLKKSTIGSTMLPFVLELGTYVVIIFSFIFLFYINSFMMKRRKKEFALYNILGMEKKHVTLIMFLETLITMFISIVLGILIGTLFSQLMCLFLINLIRLETTISFEIPLASILMTLKIFIPIYFLSYLFNVIQMRLTKPIELLKGGQIGEKEPKTKWILTIIGLLCLGSGYYIAQTIEDPVVAIMLFFIAVILVIIGTYALFTSGSITLLKALKKNKRFYYQTRHFTSVSQMIYRMKQNAVGLASICILCTCILVMISSTVSLYLGIQDSAHALLKEDAMFYIGSENEVIGYQEMDVIKTKLVDQLKKKDVEIENYVLKRGIYQAVVYQDNQFITGVGSDAYDYTSIFTMTLDDYNKTYHKNMTLKENEVLFYDNFLDLDQTMKINDHSYQIKEKIDDLYLPSSPGFNDSSKTAVIVFNNEETMRKAIIADVVETACYAVSIDFKHESDGKVADSIIRNIIHDNAKSFVDGKGYSTSIETRYQLLQSYIDMFGSLFFLGIFLGILFLMAAILIMYYKQLSEGYEDQKRFEIMQNVGMSQKEVKQTIQSQVLIFFFLPLIVAVVHMGFAFKMIVKMFQGIILSETGLFLWCTVISIVILVIIYSIIYFFTARTYYKIVKH